MAIAYLAHARQRNEFIAADEPYDREVMLPILKPILTRLAAANIEYK